ncbi:ATP-binding protein [Candidatus Nitrosocosmicus sp. FF01]|uniref:ATP-binding protein n=1 Tax=Candidatus Nitrosocosmicus sp. FF01 TaxID=3397670 RepID=UPI0039EA1B7C
MDEEDDNSKVTNDLFCTQEKFKQNETDAAAIEPTRIIKNPIKTKQYFVDLIQDAREEILILFPSLNAVKRETITGITGLLRQKSSENIRIRILSPVNVKEILFSENTINNDDDKKNKNKVLDNILTREIRKQEHLASTIVIVDRKYVLVTELKDDSKELFEEAVGTSAYSLTKPTTQSYTSIFESLWDQTEMAENLKTANKALLQSEQLEREFINTAAHELRTPTQSITGYSEMNNEIFDDFHRNENNLNPDDLRRIIKSLHRHHEFILRNAERLNVLINNLLDVARFESSPDNDIKLYKEKVEAVKEINDLIADYFSQKIKEKEIKINFINSDLGEKWWVYADKFRLNQILINLIDNAIKFSQAKGEINILIKDNNDFGFDISKRQVDEVNPLPKKDESNDFEHQRIRGVGEIYIGISDSGKGISTNIMPKLFQKFVTDSDFGTGLGLYITKKLVEAHEGRIWAYNNSDGIGSTFVFSLPSIDKNSHS